MWSPTDKYALPSKEEKIQANKVISDLKIELVCAEEQLAQAQLRVTNLRKELRERKAWVATIRKLSHDELAIIFNMCAERDWMATMRIASVCRTWRHAVLATHRAWSFIDMKYRGALKLLPLFLERSGQCAFHVGLDKDASEEVYAAVIRMADRIQCLAMPKITSQLSQVVFPALIQLVLNDEPRPLSLSLLKRSQFPALRHLDINYIPKPHLSIPDEAVDCPVIQSLDIFGFGELDFFPIVQNFGSYLKELRVCFYKDTFFSNQSTIHLPQLEILALRDWRNEDYSIIHTIVAPRLKILLAEARYPTQSFPLQMDLSLLARLRVCSKQKPPLSALRGLKVLQLYDWLFYSVEILEPLLHDPSICPALENIEICWGENGSKAYSDAQEMIIQINGSRGGNIKLISLKQHQLAPPLVYSRPCGRYMPCYVEPRE